MAMGEFTYAYLLQDEGLFRVNVSDFGGACKNELKLECVFYDPSASLSAMGLFSHGHNVYMIGGNSAETGRYLDGSSFYSFNTTRFNEFPVKDCVDEPEFYGDFRPVKWPHVVRDNRMFYFFPHSVAGFYFQSFDPAENRFYTLPPPPFVLDNRIRVSRVYGDFVLRGYIYLFVEEFIGYCFRAFSFNTRLLKWREEESMVLQFKEKDIPLPYNHRGRIGLSHVFSDNTHVLVALSGRMPTAYRVCLHSRGSFSPKSYRHLHEIYVDNGPYDEDCCEAQLFDLGSGRFCWIDYSQTEGLVVCVFKIDFAHEHEIQISSINEGRLIFSSEIISSKKFYTYDIPFTKDTWFNDVCLCSAPALHSYFFSAPSNEDLFAMSGNQEDEVTRAPRNEDQHKDEFYVDEEDMEAEQEYEQFEGSVGEKRARSSSSLVSKRSEEKGNQVERESQEHDPVALARSLASHFEMNGLDKTGDNTLSRWFIRSQLKTIMCGLAMIDRADTASEQRIIRESEYAASEAKVKALELQLEASNKANSAAQARLEALEHDKMKLRETVKAQRKELRAKDVELVSTRDKVIQEWKQSEEFRQAAQSYARENMDNRKRRCRSRD